ncbi:hypothetical protein ANCCEY_10186 [Ancylostoma ceylanicum]|uniref:Uncharacterized protein n=1 Tax=Ancylostoma ceylanicum TaxID=53326 RepID=A0A0D6LSU3_9BILA|nr:hypothetical protein ANCCEY_10186 [Ancylostoma ceylanicum]
MCKMKHALPGDASNNGDPSSAAMMTPFFSWMKSHVRLACPLCPRRPFRLRSREPSPSRSRRRLSSSPSNLMAALRGGTPAIPGLLQNLMQGVNPLQMMLNPQIPTSSANINAAQAANQMLQQAGLTISASGQIMQSKKWRRDERRQRELEQRLALALTTSHLTSEALANPLWKELLEAAQPKFTLNDDPQYFEQITNPNTAVSS